jgi:hypothetical protein
MHPNASAPNPDPGAGRSNRVCNTGLATAHGACAGRTGLTSFVDGMEDLVRAAGASLDRARKSWRRATPFVQLAIGDGGLKLLPRRII